MHGDVLPWTILSQGFLMNGQRIPLVSQQGIFRPKHLQYPLTIRTAPKGPYNDNFTENGFLLYKYRGFNHFHPDNVGLRAAMKSSTPLIYFFWGKAREVFSGMACLYRRG